LESIYIVSYFLKLSCTSLLWLGHEAAYLEGIWSIGGFWENSERKQNWKQSKTVKV